MWALVAACTAFAGEPAVWQPLEPIDLAERAPASFTIAPLLLRDDDLLVGVTGEELRIWLLEQTRGLGWPVAGAENLLFGKDLSGEARYVLGGEILSVDSVDRDRVHGVGIEVRWELLDRRSDEVVYKVFTRGWVPRGEPESLGRDLLLVALKNVLARSAFVERLEAGRRTPTPSGETLRLMACDAPPRSLPGGFEDVLPVVVGIHQGNHSGSGAIASPDGFVWTAAHVVSGSDPVRVTLHSGPSLSAQVVRLDTERDAALLKLPGEGFPCAPLASAPPAIGQGVFAVGSPLGAERSVSGGLVSSIRTVDGARLVQTDAAINPGSSGGPLLDASGTIVGIVSAKIAGPSVEGLAFAVPADELPEILGIEIAERSSPVDGVSAAPAAVEVVVDEPDPSFDAPASDPRPPLPTRPRAPGDGRLCLFRTGGKAVLSLQVAGTALDLPPRSRACMFVDAGTILIERPLGLPWSLQIDEGETAYVRSSAGTLSRVSGESFVRIKAKLAEIEAK